MGNQSKERRERMIAELEQLKQLHNDDSSIAALNEIENALNEKKYGLVFEEHTEEVDYLLENNIPILIADKEKVLCKDRSLPWNYIIEGDNLQALYLLEKTHHGKVDCIYIDPPYNTGARDWKYNNDYVDSNDTYRHSKWLSMMKSRLLIAKKLLNPNDSVLIVTIDEKEYLHLGCLLEEMFKEASIQMITNVINPSGTMRQNEFSRVEEYLFICRFGNSIISKTERNMLGNDDNTAKSRLWYPFNRSNNSRLKSHGQFYPIYIDAEKKCIVEIGEPLDLEYHENDFPKRDGLVSVFPYRENGDESIWGAIPSTARKWKEKGYLRLGDYDEKTKRWSIQYIRSSWQDKLDNGDFGELSYDSNGVLDFSKVEDNGRKVSPKSVWMQKSHNATDYGSNLIKSILIDNRFSYPKSLYAVRDTIRFFVTDKPDAIIVDFFSGSGTTMHAVNLLNKEDGGKRKCIMVTNNEISETEQKEFEAKGIHKGDPEWEARGIARYVTWPRTVCAIQGVDVKGNPLKGDYISTNTCEKEISKKVVQVSYLKDFKTYKIGDKKDFVNAISERKIPKSSITLDTAYIIPEDSDVSVLLDDSQYENWLDELEEADNIKTYIIISENKKLFNQIKTQIFNRFGTYKEIVPVTIPMSEGFMANVKYMKCEWTPRKPEDYLLSNALCLHIKELIELQTFQEIDGIRNVIIFNRNDFKKIFENKESLEKVESVWVNENLIFSSSEFKMLKSKNFKYIPRKYFSQELKEVGEYV